MKQVACHSAALLLFPRIFFVRCSDFYFITSVMLLKFSGICVYVTRTLFGLPYKLVTRSQDHVISVIENRVQHNFITKTNFVVVRVVHAATRTCRHQAYENI